MIPKKIHYCWFGGNPKPEIIEKCIASWHQYCPDWEIIEWNESNYDVGKRAYTKEAYDAKMWAFVSDVVRLDVVCNNGGIYLDTDVELKTGIEELRSFDAFFVFETDRNINTGIGFGAVAGHPSVKAMLEYYEDRTFVKNGKMDMSPCPAKNTEALKACCNEFNRNGKRQIFQRILVLSGCDYAYIAKHYSTGLWGLGMNAEDNAFVFRDTKLKRLLRKPEYFDWIEDHLGMQAANIYTFLVYDFLDLGPMYYIKRYTKRLFGKQ